ncbi:MAG: hypothetical protein OXC13_01660 [Caldilineaceae bacterium]|nr:hypothetical protein [Caldilineaceae bacterium]
MPHTRLPLPPGPLQDSLALWLQGTLLAGNGCLDRVAAALAARGGNVHTLRRRLCDGLKDDADRQDAWGADQELDVETCLAPLLAWVLSWMVLHGPGHAQPWVLLTDATLYACRDWIEQGFRGLKRAGWQWQRTRRTDPVRAGRHWLVLVVATLLAVAYGTRREEAAALGRTPAQLRTPPADRPGPVGPPTPQPPTPGDGLPGGPAGPGAVVDAGLAAAPARSLRAAGRPRSGPGALTQRSASDTQTRPPSPRGSSPRAGRHVPNAPTRALRPPRNLRTRIPPPKARAAGERRSNRSPVPHTRSHAYTCQEAGVVYATFQTDRSPVQFLARDQPEALLTVPAGFRPAVDITWEVSARPVRTDGTPHPDPSERRVFRTRVDTAGQVRYVDDAGVDGTGYLGYDTVLAWPLAGIEPQVCDLGTSGRAF